MVSLQDDAAAHLMHLPVTPVTAERLDQVSSRNIPRELAAPPSRPQFHEVRIVDRHRVGIRQVFAKRDTGTDSGP